MFNFTYDKINQKNNLNEQKLESIGIKEIKKE